METVTKRPGLFVCCGQLFNYFVVCLLGSIKISEPCLPRGKQLKTYVSTFCASLRTCERGSECHESEAKTDKAHVQWSTKLNTSLQLLFFRKLP
jgi:hypothetical protein